VDDVENLSTENVEKRLSYSYMDDVENLSTAIVENSKVSILSHLIFFLLAKSIRAWNVSAKMFTLMRIWLMRT